MSIRTTIALNNGVSMPVIGLGVFQLAENTVDAVKWALDFGYRHFDTASFYKNEKYVGQAIRDSNIAREDIFVTTKIWNDMQRKNLQIEAFENSMAALGLDYIDLYLIHWPVPGKFIETWKVLEKLYLAKKVKAIGVSNFLEHHLDSLLEYADIIPAVNQFECHPYNTMEPLRKYCSEKGIVCEAWGPLGRGELIHEETILKIADSHGKSVPQVILRWNYQSGIVTIPKSGNKERIRQNIDIFDFELAEDEMKTIDSLNKNQIHEDPDNFTF